MISSAFLLADTPGSIIHRVTLADGRKAILKRLKPRGLGELPGMAFLEWRNGNGAVRLLEKHATACLLEDAGDILLRHHRLQHGEAASNEIIIDLLGRLHSTGGTAPTDLTPLLRHFQSLFDRASKETDERLAEPLRFCADLATSLLDSQENVRPLHGDLHHDNIIGGGERGWLAIDPQGLMGDPAYDVANVFGNPLNALQDILDPHRIRTLIDLFSTALNCPKDKILRYAIAHAGLSICWSLEDGTPFDESVNAQERLSFLRVARPLLLSP